MNQKNLIITFTRNPELGKVKTRLAKTIGNPSALAIYKKLLEHTESVLRPLNCDKAVYYSVKIRENDIWDSTIYQKHQQTGEHLGARMANAFKHGFKNNYQKIIIVGSDLYDLKTEHINQAFQDLETNDVVLGPAEDGGYYLLGMKQFHPKLFRNKNWGTDSVLKDTLKDLKEESVFLLETLNDIDFFEDLEKHNDLKLLINK
ncbi:Glycosyltransferase [Mesoflavibacter sp. HG96]|uniref:TIGR04282 family arsenosugar biosynthesis glycosyltransferase n=1 Tax=Mesoflavibacter profundi TaxID=2708110 RepID=A0ABT4S0H0_9FLAO|nr:MULTISPECIES: TIGR04282 family arsenosugar biosynthesis glycosyltransferase [Mesoflavibacter]MDA0177570.1 TIGR04282 family arsenosugar biosynthesis glycosyltransferase [Mesoflavibacter profundi]QIJ88525.1 Glycosyltransferase [Mesoflavibacter sp. HG96]QIJ91253.1 Glycosyltransferase [Mesoflavibacter sp. HG37]